MSKFNEPWKTTCNRRSVFNNENAAVFLDLFNDKDGDRIVACVNACEGIENPQELRTQRDRLLMVAKEIVNHPVTSDPVSQKVTYRASFEFVETVEDLIIECEGDKN